MLVGPIGPKLKQLLNKNIQIAQDVLISNDEIHLILEYSLNDEWLNFKTPTSNRFIVSHDINNSKMHMLDAFFKLIHKYEPNLIILSGLHLLESQENGLRQVFKISLKSILFNLLFRLQKRETTIAQKQLK